MAIIICLKLSSDEWQTTSIKKLIESIWIQKGGDAIVHVECIIEKKSKSETINGIRFLVSGLASETRDRRDLFLNRSLCNHLYDEGWEILSNDESLIKTDTIQPVYIGTSLKPLIKSISTFIPPKGKTSRGNKKEMKAGNFSDIRVVFTEANKNQKYYGIRIQFRVRNFVNINKASLFSEKIFTFEKRLYDNKAIIGGISSLIHLKEIIPLDVIYIWVVFPLGAVPFVFSEERIFNKQIITPEPWKLMDPAIKSLRLVFCWKFDELKAIPEWSEKRIILQHTFPPPAAWLTWLGFFSGILGLILAILAFLL